MTVSLRVDIRTVLIICMTCLCHMYLIGLSEGFGPRRLGLSMCLRPRLPFRWTGKGRCFDSVSHVRTMWIVRSVTKPLQT